MKVAVAGVVSLSLSLSLPFSKRRKRDRDRDGARVPEHTLYWIWCELGRDRARRCSLNGRSARSDPELSSCLESQAEQESADGR